MCGQAEEIQRLWRPAHGDFYSDAKGRIRCWIDTSPPPERFKKGFGICVKNSVIHLSKYIWLPRQDQLIELAQVPGRRYESIVQDFFDWSKRPYRFTTGNPGRHFKTMEKVWLVFVMQQKFSRLWDGDTWIKRFQPA